VSALKHSPCSPYVSTRKLGLLCVMSSIATLTFPVQAGSAGFAAITICCESGFTRFSSCQVFTQRLYLEKALEMYSFSSWTRVTPTNTMLMNHDKFFYIVIRECAGDHGIEIQFPGGAKNSYLSQSIQTDSGDLPPYCPTGK
jgi:hypothetical protein